MNPPNGLRIIEIPAKFYEDHCDRMSDKDPSVPAYSDVYLRRKGHLAVVQVCDAALDEIESDADYYAELRPGIDTERELAGLIRSAKATLKRIKAFRAQAASR